MKQSNLEKLEESAEHIVRFDFGSKTPVGRALPYLLAIVKAAQKLGFRRIDQICKCRCCGVVDALEAFERAEI